jgi:phosphoglycolate phosphatase-like HAD superfamily hydrolase
MNEPNPPLVWLFDVDGTLIVTDGAAREAFSLGFFDTTGMVDDMSRVAFGGRTDPLILDELLALHGLVWDDATRARFWRATHAHMESLLAKGRGRVLPGVVATLDALDAQLGWTPALLTGNSATMAGIKLGHYRLAHRFRFGAYGNEAPDRDSLARIAVARAGVGPRRCLVVGDTESDIRCARAAGAWVAAVATGIRSRAELAAHQPDLLLDDMADPAPLLEFARALPT